jgi:hypothetical protein
MSIKEAETPILFTPWNVRRMMDGFKTQTRRLLKPQPPPELNLFEVVKSTGEWCFYNADNPDDQDYCYYMKPNYKPGTVLWVREKWSYKYPKNNSLEPCGFLYKADDGDLNTEKLRLNIQGGWKPSIHMPRAACRLRLVVEAVRVERLQEITEDDAKAEGAPRVFGYENEAMNGYRKGFEQLWNSINKKPGTTWYDNPFVQAITFSVKEVKNAKQ